MFISAHLLRVLIFQSREVTLSVLSLGGAGNAVLGGDMGQGQEGVTPLSPDPWQREGVRRGDRPNREGSSLISSLRPPLSLWPVFCLPFSGCTFSH